MSGEAHPTATVEEYLEAILNMISEKRTVVAARLAERLQVSRPTVTATLHRMARNGLITADQHKEIQLTEKGMKTAINIVRRHRLAERLLTDILKIPWHEVHEEACILEHAISERVMDRMYETLGRPTTCPHGNSIPVDYILPPIEGFPLDTVPTGQTVVVERISEEATKLAELMQYLWEVGMKPGAVVSVQEVADYAGTMTVRVGGKIFSVGMKAAALVWVTPSSEA